METITAKDARDHLSEVINQVAYGKKHYVLTRRGSGVVAIIPVKELEILEKAMQAIEDAEDIRDAEIALKDTEKHGTISMQEMKKHLGLDVPDRVRKKRPKAAQRTPKTRR